MKKNNLILFIFFYIVAYAYPQGNNNIAVKKMIINILVKYSVFYDSNPIYKCDNDEIYYLFKIVILNKEEITEKKRSYLRYKIFNILYDNAISIYEDSTDILRLTKRRILCYMTLALLSPSDDRFRHFLDCAKLSAEPIDFLIEMQYREYALIHLLKIYMLINLDNREFNEEISLFCNYIHNNYQYFYDDFIEDVIKILNCIKK